MGTTPIVLIHQGDNDYLFRTLFMLNKFYKPTDIYLIGNKANKHYKGWCTHFSISDLKQHTKSIANSFFNLSTNGADFELFCIERWFILSAFLKQQKIGQAIYLDTDILIYESLEEYCNKFKGFGITMVGISGHTNFVLKPESLTKFCDWILNLYTTSEGKETINQWYQDHLKISKRGGISDMTFFNKYAEISPSEVLNLASLNTDFFFDRTFSESNGFETDTNGKKLVYWNNEKPFLKNLTTKALVKVVTLHFQGFSKPNMILNLKPKTTKFYIWDAYFQLRRVVNKVINKSKK